MRLVHVDQNRHERENNARSSSTILSIEVTSFCSHGEDLKNMRLTECFVSLVLVLMQVPSPAISMVDRAGGGGDFLPKLRHHR